MTMSPMEYEQAAVIAIEAGHEALLRLDWMTIEPRIILNAGCGSLKIQQQLAERYPAAQIIADDNIATLPTSSVDMVFANLVLSKQSSQQVIVNLLQEWRRVLRAEGLLMFTALGRDTLQQLQGICNSQDIPLLFDMHDCGDMLLQAGFADPVLDVDYYTLSYQETDKLWHELRASNMLCAELTTAMKNRLQPASDGSYELTFEVINAHAFAPPPGSGYRPSEEGITRIPLSHLRRK